VEGERHRGRRRGEVRFGAKRGHWRRSKMGSTRSGADEANDTGEVTGVRGGSCGTGVWLGF
jgi:hypothetical protein